jgi:predicted transposase YbfD/YdcC
VTIDAAGCQRSIAKEIKTLEADYILSVKENHLRLYRAIKMHLNVQTPLILNQWSMINMKKMALHMAA